MERKPWLRWSGRELAWLQLPGSQGTSCSSCRKMLGSTSKTLELASQGLHGRSLQRSNSCLSISGHRGPPFAPGGCYCLSSAGGCPSGSWSLEGVGPRGRTSPWLRVKGWESLGGFVAMATVAFSMTLPRM